MYRLGLTILAAILIALSIVRVPATPTTVVIEAENFAHIDPPMRIVRTDPSVSGKAHIELPLGAGQGWRGKGTGGATYRVDLSDAATYTVWARALWGDGCTNAFFLTPNQEPRMVFGNDAVFKRWHWVKGQSIRLQKGVNYFAFTNHSDGTALDKIVLTSDPFYTPEGLGEDITYFFDGFAGCDADNTGSWQFASGTWRVIPAAPDTPTAVSDCLAQWSTEEALALGGFPVWHDYEARVKVMLSEPGTVGLIVYRSNPQNYCLLLWNIQEDNATLSLREQAGGQELTLAETAAIQGALDHWYELGIKREGNELVCTLDGQPALRAPSHLKHTGQIGLMTRKTMGVYFDNVQVSFD